MTFLRNACKKLGHCVKQDDMAMVISKMKASNVIVLATPVYFYTMDGAGAWQLGDILHNPAMQEAYEMGKAI